MAQRKGRPGEWGDRRRTYRGNQSYYGDRRRVKPQPAQPAEPIDLAEEMIALEHVEAQEGEPQEAWLKPPKSPAECRQMVGRDLTGNERAVIEFHQRFPIGRRRECADATGVSIKAVRQIDVRFDLGFPVESNRGIKDRDLNPRERSVVNWLNEHPEGSRRECSQQTGVGYGTVCDIGRRLNLKFRSSTSKKPNPSGPIAADQFSGASSSGIRGVWRTKSNTFFVVIGVGGEKKYLGSYATLEEAAAVRRRAEKQRAEEQAAAGRKYTPLQQTIVDWMAEHPGSTRKECAEGTGLKYSQVKRAAQNLPEVKFRLSPAAHPSASDLEREAREAAAREAENAAPRTAKAQNAGTGTADAEASQPKQPWKPEDLFSERAPKKAY